MSVTLAQGGAASLDTNNFDAGIFNSATSAFTTMISRELYQLDPSTGDASKIASTDFGLITVANQDGTVYGFDGVTNQIVTLNVMNGHTIFISNIDPALGLVEGVAAVPEPASVAPKRLARPVDDPKRVAGDLITAIDGQRVEREDALVRAIANKRVGDTITLTIFRGNRTITLPVKLLRAPSDVG